MTADMDRWMTRWRSRPPAAVAGRCAAAVADAPAVPGMRAVVGIVVVATAAPPYAGSHVWCILGDRIIDPTRHQYPGPIAYHEWAGGVCPRDIHAISPMCRCRADAWVLLGVVGLVDMVADPDRPGWADPGAVSIGAAMRMWADVSTVATRARRLRDEYAPADVVAER